MSDSINIVTSCFEDKTWHLKHALLKILLWHVLPRVVVYNKCDLNSTRMKCVQMCSFVMSKSRIVNFSWLCSHCSVPNCQS